MSLFRLKLQPDQKVEVNKSGPVCLLFNSQIFSVTNEVLKPCGYGSQSIYQPEMNKHRLVTCVSSTCHP